MAESEIAHAEPAPAAVPDEASKKGQDVSASTVARLMGLATASDLKLLDGKLELLISRIASLTVKVEKNNQLMQKVATTNDIDRVDLQVSNLKTIVKKLFMAVNEKSDVLKDKESVEEALESLEEK